MYCTNISLHQYQLILLCNRCASTLFLSKREEQQQQQQEQENGEEMAACFSSVDVLQESGISAVDIQKMKASVCGLSLESSIRPRAVTGSRCGLINC